MHTLSTPCSILPGDNQTFVLMTPAVRARQLAGMEGLFSGGSAYLTAIPGVGRER